jgi:YbbR domain-containing protein
MEKIWGALTVNLGTKLISVAIAIVLWVIVLGSRNVEVTKEVPLEVITPGELVASNEIPTRVAFRLSGPKAFLRAELDRVEEPIRVNLADKKPGIVTYRFFSDNIRLPIGVKVVSINPPTILIKLEYLKRKEVPLKLELKGALPNGYRLVKAEVHPSTVKIKGPESHVDTLAEVASNPIDLSTFKQTTSTDVSVEFSRYSIQADGPMPKATLEIEPTLAANYKIKNVDVQVLTHLRAKVEPKNVTISVRTDPDKLKLLDRSHVKVLLDLQDKSKGSYDLEPKVSLPDGVGFVGVLPEHVHVTLF